MNGISRIALSLAALALAGFAVYALIDRSAVAERAAERRALLAREVELSRIALTPGSALACLDGGAGETVENVCEKAVFASAQSTAAAVAYMDARLKLLTAAAARDPGLLRLLASTRRAVALDRFGVAAHVLAIRDGCTAEKCDAFALVDDASALQANLRAQVYDQYVSRYVASWSAPPTPAEKLPAVSALPPPTSLARVTASGQTAVPAVKPGEHWDFPSAASIPAVSILGAEPPLPKGAEAQAQAPGQARGQAADAPAATPCPPPSLLPNPQRSPQRRRPPRASIGAAGSADVQIRPDRQSRRDRLPHHPHRPAHGPAHGRGLFRRRP